jgi:ribosomal protein S18 acetylase RimI-like enzyme
MITKLDATHLEQLHTFLAKNVSSFFDPHPYTVEYLSQMLAACKKDSYFVNLLDGAIVAYGFLRGMDQGYEIPGLGICVDVDYRGQGLGRAMVEYMHEYAKQEKYKQIRIRVFKNNRQSLELHKTLGYIFTDDSDGRMYIGRKDLV